jgi:hypothetical protein
MGGGTPQGTSVAAQSSSRRFVFFFDSSASAKAKSASSKPTRELKGDQSVAGGAVGDNGGASKMRNSPCSLHRLAIGPGISQRGGGAVRHVCAAPVRNG